MKKRQLATVIVGAAAAAIVFVGSAARARAASDTVGVAFGCDCSCCALMGLDCMDPACISLMESMMVPVGTPTGVVDSVFFNSVQGPDGVFPNLIRDMRGTLVPTAAKVLWASTNVFSSTGLGVENNEFTGSNRALMSGYLDQDTSSPSPTFVQITNIPVDMAGKYDVVIYTLGSVPDRGGEYAVNGGITPGVDLKFVVASGSIRGNAVFNGPVFVEASPGTETDPAYGQTDWGNYVMFTGLSGTTVTITATNKFALPGDVPRAPINGIQIINRQP